jgi:hypothetical protein
MASAIDAPYEASLLAEILPEEVNKALSRLFLSRKRT